MDSSIATKQPTAVAPPKLVVYHKDPVAGLAFRAFGRAPGLLFMLMALVGVVCLYVIPATNGTLVPRPGFLSALSDINSAIIWLLLIPAAAMAYVGQLARIPELFDRLQTNGVTGLTNQEYQAFLQESNRHYNRGIWSLIALLGFAPVWALFLVAVSRSAYTWYYPPNFWPWLLYISIQYLEIYAAISYAIRYFITTRRLRKLLLRGQLFAEVLHPDGVAGFGPVATFVQGSLQVAGGVLLVATLQSINTARSVTQFSQGSGVVVFIVVALLYVTIVPY